MAALPWVASLVVFAGDLSASSPTTVRVCEFGFRPWTRGRGLPILCFGWREHGGRLWLIKGRRKPGGEIVLPNSVQIDSPLAEVRATEAAVQASEQRLAAERALDAILADSFPASDPPPWTLGVSHRRED